MRRGLELKSEPRGRLFQGARFEVTELRGGIVEQLLGVTSQADTDDRPEMMFLRPQGGHWQRFFLDAGIAFWEEWSETDAFADSSGLRRVDYGARFRLVGVRIRRAHGYRAAPEPAARIELELATGVLQLRAIDPGDPDSDSEVTFRPRRGERDDEIAPRPERS